MMRRATPADQPGFDGLIVEAEEHNQQRISMLRFRKTALLGGLELDRFNILPALKDRAGRRVDLKKAPAIAVWCCVGDGNLDLQQTAEKQQPNTSMGDDDYIVKL